VGALPKSYSNGFALVSQLIGDRYVTPPGLLFDTNAIWLAFSGGNVTAQSNLLTVLPGLKTTPTNGVTFSVTASTGLFKGAAKFAEFKKATRYQGAVLPDLGLGGGYFAGTNQFGRVQVNR
jgi:hypothetical protein